MSRALTLGLLRGASPVVGISIQALIIQTIGLAGAGSLAVLLSMSSVCAALIGLGLPASISRRTAVTPGDRIALLTSSWMLATVSTFALTVVLTVGQPFVGQVSGGGWQRSVLLGSLAGASAMQAIIVAANRGASRPVTATAVELYAGRCIWLVCLIVAITSVRQPSLEQLLVVGICAAMFATAIGLFQLVRSDVTNRRRPSLSLAKDLLSSSRPLLINQLALMLTSAIALWTLHQWSTPAETGAFHLASRLALFAGIPGVVVQLLAGPELAQRSADGTLAQIQPRLNLLVRIATSASLVIAAVTLGLHRVIIDRIADQAVHGLLWPTAILLFGQLINVSTGPCGYALIMGRLETATCRATLSGMAVTAVASVTLIPSVGVTGAAIATAAGVITTNSLNARIAAGTLGLHTTCRARLALA